MATVKLRQIRNFDGQRRARFISHPHAAKKIKLPDCLVALQVDHRIHGLVAAGEKRTAGVAKRVESSRTDQGLDGALIAHNLGNLVKEVLEVGELSLFPSGLHDGINDVSSNVLNRVQTETNILPIRSKGSHRMINIGRKNRNSHVTTFRQIKRTAILVVLR